jgi:dTDP-4-amino-4,6-dideoxygalactose transaminase
MITDKEMVRTGVEAVLATAALAIHLLALAIMELGENRTVITTAMTAFQARYLLVTFLTWVFRPTSEHHY